MFYYDWSIILLIPAFIITIWAQWKVKSTFNKFSKVKSLRGLTGQDVAAQILKYHNIQNVCIGKVAGSLSDHYNPKKKELNLSESVYGSDSIAAIGVAAHEVGHAIQDAEKYPFLVMRSAMYPVTKFGSFLAPILFIAGIILSSSNLIWVGVGIFAIAVLFTVITLPVEIDASRRAMKALSNLGILQGEELKGSKKVLTAAAYTYIAAAITAILELTRFIIIAQSND